MQKIILFILCYTLLSAIQAQNTANDSLLVQIEQAENKYQQVLLLINYVENTIGVRPAETRAYKEKAFSYFDDNVFPNRAIVSTIWETLINRSQGKFELAIKENLAVVATLEQHSNSDPFAQKLLSKMLGYLGQLYARSHYYEPALDYFFRALTIAEAHNYKEVEGMALNGLAVLYSENYEDNELAIEYGERALALSKETANQYGNMILTDNMAKYQTKVGNLQKALPLHQEAIRLAKALNRTPYLSDFYNNLGTNYLKQGKIEKAIDAGELAITVATESRNAFVLGYSYHLLGKCMQEKKDWLAAAAYYDKALVTAKQSRDFKFIAELLNDLGQSSIYKQQSFKATTYFQEAIAYKDSLYQAFKIKQVLELETRHRVQNIAQEKALLQQEKSLQNKIIKGQRQQLWLLGGLGLLAIMSSMVFFFQKKQLDASYQTLVEKNRALVVGKQKKKTKVKSTQIDQQLKDKIEHILINNQLYLQTDITVHKLAKLVDSNTTYVSKTINEGFHKNFSSLINEYRIKAALEYLEAGQYEQFTIESLGQKAGFKSRAAFINAFKKYTGVTPSFYIKQLKEQKE